MVFPCLPSNPSTFLADLYICIWLLSRENLFLSYFHHTVSSDINMNWGYGPVWSSQEKVEITSMWPIKAILNTHWWVIIASYFPSWCKIYSIYWRGRKRSPGRHCLCMALIKRDRARDGPDKLEEEFPFTQPHWMNQNLPSLGHGSQKESLN